MHSGYRLLEVTEQDDAIIASLPLSKVIGFELNQTLREDCQRLIKQASCPVVLDLREVQSIDGSFFARVVELWRGLQSRSLRLSVQLSPGLAEIAAITKLDRLLEIAESEIDDNVARK